MERDNGAPAGSEHSPGDMGLRYVSSPWLYTWFTVHPTFFKFADYKESIDRLLSENVGDDQPGAFPGAVLEIARDISAVINKFEDAADYVANKEALFEKNDAKAEKGWIGGGRTAMVRDRDFVVHGFLAELISEMDTVAGKITNLPESQKSFFSAHGLDEPLPLLIEVYQDLQKVMEKIQVG